VRYEEITIDTYFKSRVRRFAGILSELFAKFLANNAMARSKVSYANFRMKVPFDTRVEVGQDLYVVASNVDNSPLAGPESFVSRAQAEELLAAERARQPYRAGELHVIPVTEARLAA
jgi:hypothetical protein